VTTFAIVFEEVTPHDNIILVNKADIIFDTPISCNKNTSHSNIDIQLRSLNFALDNNHSHLKPLSLFPQTQYHSTNVITKLTNDLINFQRTTFKKKRVAWRVPLAGQELHLISTLVFSFCLIVGFFCAEFGRSLFVVLSFLFWPLYCLFFFDLRLLVTPLVSFGHCFVCSSSIYGFWWHL
jgi:hypothetical protein